MEKPKPYKRSVVYDSRIAEAIRIVWPPGSMSEPHDHGISRGTIWVIRGTVVQKIFDKETKEHKVTTTHKPGDVFEETPDIIHIMGNPSVTEEAETFHVYSPPLKMTDYNIDDLKFK